jgi:predicted Zn-dependent protease
VAAVISPEQVVAPAEEPTTPEAVQPQSEPEAATPTTTQAKRPQVEVAPEFAATPPPTQKTAASTSSKKPLVIGVGVVVAVVAGAGIFMSGRSKSPDASAANAPKAAAGMASQASVPTAATPPSGPSLDRQWLNQLMGLAANNDWAAVQAQLEQAQPTVPAAVDKAAAREKNARALAALGSGDVQGALPLLTEAAARDPGDPEIQNNLGYAYLLAGRLDDARQHLLQTLQIAPTRGQAWANTADLFAQSGNAEVAQAALKLAVFLATDRARALASLSREDNLGHEKFKAVAKAVVAEADRIPAFKR